MNSIRIRNQVRTLGSQTGLKHLSLAYEDATQNLGSYGYLMVDMTSRTPEFLRIRSLILNKPSYVYVSTMK